MLQMHLRSLHVPTLMSVWQSCNQWLTWQHTPSLLFREMWFRFSCAE
jgi:hypothetical protein